MSLRVLVCGGRDFTDALTLGSWLGGIHRDHGISLLIEGGARGADFMARKFAEWKGIPVRTFEADWEDLSHPDAVIKRRADGTKYDAFAGFRRNQLMLDEGKPDLVVAFEGGRGTADMVDRAHAAGVRVQEAHKIMVQ